MRDEIATYLNWTSKRCLPAGILALYVCIQKGSIALAIAMPSAQ